MVLKDILQIIIRSHWGTSHDLITIMLCTATAVAVAHKTKSVVRTSLSWGVKLSSPAFCHSCHPMYRHFEHQSSLCLHACELRTSQKLPWSQYKWRIMSQSRIACSGSSHALNHLHQNSLQNYRHCIHFLYLSVWSVVAGRSLLPGRPTSVGMRWKPQGTIPSLEGKSHLLPLLLCPIHVIN
jgi:hypothetical protein